MSGQQQQSNDDRTSNAFSMASNVQEDSHIDAEDTVIGGGFSSIDELKEARPSFIKEENLKDVDMRRPSDADYDPTTLYIPPGAWKDFTPCMH